MPRRLYFLELFVPIQPQALFR